MPPIDRIAARNCAEEALRRIADFTGPIEPFTFKHWHEFHKTIFINGVAACIRRKGSRIILNEGMLGKFATVGDFIDYVANESAYLGEPKPNLQENNGDLIL